MQAEKLLDELEARVEQGIQHAVAVFQNLDADTLLRPAADGGWSIAQCLWHLNSYGDFYLPHIANGIHNIKPGGNGSFTKGWIGGYLTRIMQPGTNKRKYKAFRDHVPPATPDAYATVSTFIHQQELLLSYLKQARNRDLNRIQIPMSITRLVKLKLGDVLMFLVAHNERHLQQASRNLA